jgi:hypothetical protein
LTAPTFSADILPKLLRQSCGASSATSCHGGNNPPGKVSYDPALSDLAVYGSLVGATPANAPGPPPVWYRVDPGHVATSWIVEKVTKDQPGGMATTYGARMPYALPNLCTETVQTLENWITNGATF